MIRIENEVFSCNCDDSAEDLLKRTADFVQRHPAALEPIRGRDSGMEALFLAEGFQLYPTVEKTTLFYDKGTDSFVKIMHPLSIRGRLLANFCEHPRKLYILSETLRSKGVKVPAISAYGRLRKRETPFVVMERMPGRQLKIVLIREKQTLPKEVYKDVIRSLAELHRAGYWFRDASLAHIYVEDDAVTGFIDADSIRKNTFFRTRHRAQDLAGLNYPELPLTNEERRGLFDYYMKLSGIGGAERFLSLVKTYTERRWKRKEQ